MRIELGHALRRLIEGRVELKGASNQGVNEALYLRNPTATVGSLIGIDQKNNGRATRRES